MVLLLIESGADVHALNEGETPFGLARIRGHVEIRELMRRPCVGSRIRIRTS
jgi:hypothetical protein